MAFAHNQASNWTQRVLSLNIATTGTVVYLDGREHDLYGSMDEMLGALAEDFNPRDMMDRSVEMTAIEAIAEGVITAEEWDQVQHDASDLAQSFPACEPRFAEANS